MSLHVYTPNYWPRTEACVPSWRCKDICHKPRHAWAATGIVVCLFVCYPRRAWAATGIVVCQLVCLFFSICSPGCHSTAWIAFTQQVITFKSGRFCFMIPLESLESQNQTCDTSNMVPQKRTEKKQRFLRSQSSKDTSNTQTLSSEAIQHSRWCGMF